MRALTRLSLMTLTSLSGSSAYGLGIEESGVSFQRQQADVSREDRQWGVADPVTSGRVRGYGRIGLDPWVGLTVPSLELGLIRVDRDWDRVMVRERDGSVSSIGEQSDRPPVEWVIQGALSAGSGPFTVRVSADQSLVATPLAYRTRALDLSYALPDRLVTFGVGYSFGLFGQPGGYMIDREYRTARLSTEASAYEWRASLEGPVAPTVKARGELYAGRRGEIRPGHWGLDGEMGVPVAERVFARLGARYQTESRSFTPTDGSGFQTEYRIRLRIPWEFDYGWHLTPGVALIREFESATEFTPARELSTRQGSMGVAVETSAGEWSVGLASQVTQQDSKLTTWEASWLWRR